MKKNNSGIILCPFCSEKETPDKIIFHIAEKHNSCVKGDELFQCPICKAELKFKNLRKHYSKVHFKDTIKDAIEEVISTCPYCGKEMPRRYLREHVDRYHPFRMKYTGKTSSVSVFNYKGTSFKNSLIQFLHKNKYKTRTYNNFVTATNENILRTICIRISNRGEFKQYEDLKSIFLTIERFRKIIFGFNNRESSLINPSGLGKDVITPYGWHAENSETARRSALACAAVVLGNDHVENLLKFLRNTWPKNPNLDQYANEVKSDYNWFISNFNGTYVRIRTAEFKQSLMNEFQQYQYKFSDSIESIYNIDNWFVLIKPSK